MEQQPSRGICVGFAFVADSCFDYPSAPSVCRLGLPLDIVSENCPAPCFQGTQYFFLKMMFYLKELGLCRLGLGQKVPGQAVTEQDQQAQPESFNL